MIGMNYNKLQEDLFDLLSATQEGAFACDVGPYLDFTCPAHLCTAIKTNDGQLSVGCAYIDRFISRTGKISFMTTIVNNNKDVMVEYVCGTTRCNEENISRNVTNLVQEYHELLTKIFESSLTGIPFTTSKISTNLPAATSKISTDLPATTTTIKMANNSIVAIGMKRFSMFNKLFGCSKLRNARQTCGYILDSLCVTLISKQYKRIF
ncbi:unnamed protein product [Adineta steineri]|uniref:Uncharacterized protein n=1 Tax=Adineta steineri TaxID=433720 RepID=A0A815NRT6_9BILA|nr:unnamed protein product [Adineta steineri]CAF3847605.1 unnamed protein product [Adineta steineri]